MKPSAKKIKTLLAALLIAAAPRAAYAAQGHATASAQVISQSDIGTVDASAVVAVTSTAPAPATADTATSSPQIQVTDSDGMVTISVDYN